MGFYYIFVCLYLFYLNPKASFFVVVVFLNIFFPFLGFIERTGWAAVARAGPLCRGRTELLREDVMVPLMEIILQTYVDLCPSALAGWTQKS